MMKKYQRSIFILLIAVVIFLITQLYKPQVYYEWNSPMYFNTVISLSFYSNKGADQADKLLKGCEEIIQDIENTFSRTKEGSVLYELNHRTSNTVEIPEEVASLIEVGLHYNQVSDGKFDITIAPVTDLWDFISEQPILPDSSDIKAVLPFVGSDKLSLEGTTLTFASDHVMIDLGALAKGYAADKVKAYLVDNGVKCGMLNFGGNVITIGNKQDKTPWRIGIRKPFTKTEEYVAVVPVTDQTLVTSGIYERYFEKDGILYHHILDPSTGYPATSDIISVTIVTDSSLIADALSTTCLLLNYEKARELIDSLVGVEAVFILNTGELIQTTEWNA